jgi:Domain of Unknown Function (DUF1259)
MKLLSSASWVDVGMLESILHGSADVSPSDGVVTVTVPRRDELILGRVDIDPTLNVATTVAFEQINRSSATVSVSLDFSLVADEMQQVMGIMRSQNPPWDVHCLYNQETAEHRQLFFSHQLKIGNDPYELAREVRAGLDQTNSKGSPFPPPNSHR